MHLPTRELSRREWLMIIAIVMMVEYWILSLSYEFRSSSTVVNFVSFAAAITSLLLAVIAIIFSFLQSDAQQNATTRMMGQIDSLRSVATSLDDSGDSIALQASELGSATDQLKQLSVAVNGAYQKIIDLEGHVSGIKGTQESISEAFASLAEKQNEKASSPASETIATASNVYLLFQATAYEADFLGYCIWLYLRLDPARRPSLLDAMYKIYVESLRTARKDAVRDGAIELLFAYLSVARSMRIMARDWTIASNLESEIKVVAQETEASSGAEWMVEAIRLATHAAEAITPLKNA